MINTQVIDLATRKKGGFGSTGEIYVRSSQVRKRIRYDRKIYVIQLIGSQFDNFTYDVLICHVCFSMLRMHRAVAFCSAGIM